MHSFTEDFEGRGRVFVKIRRWPGENHINANSVGQGQAIGTCSPAVYISYICMTSLKISKWGMGICKDMLGQAMA
jgi:hypothetical protein